ncbi:MAG TPA: hypothetical protein VFO31_11310 [Vicinamibacterales bacterium]|nr:hypothetical protein [Vicinamibacterales bacterium]
MNVLARMLVALMIVQAVAGLAWPDVYRDAGWIKATWLGNDTITLFVAVPLMWMGHAAARRGSPRGQLLVAGVSGYALYNYAFYLFGASLNAHFPIYVAGFVTSALALMLMVSSLDPRAFTGHAGPSVPVRIVGAGLVATGALLATVWAAMWAAYVFAGQPTPVEPDAFRLIAGLDLSLMAPALVGGGALLWRRAPWGYVVAGIAGIQAALYLLVLSVNSVIAIRRGFADAPGELPIWGTLAVGMIVSAGTLLAHAGAPIPARREEQQCCDARL